MSNKFSGYVFLEELKEGKSVSFEFPQKYKRAFKQQVDRIVEAERLRGRSVYYFYYHYVFLRGLWISRKSESLELALDVYMLAHRDVLSIEGEDVGRNIRVTYKPKR